MIKKIIRGSSTAWNLYKSGATFTSILLFPLRRRMAQPHNRIDFHNGLSLSSPPDVALHHLVKEIWVGRCYTPQKVVFAPGDVIVDIGANVGVFAVWMAAGNPQARVIGVEPSPDAFEYLQSNVSVNHLRNVSLLRAACAGRTGEADLYSRGAGGSATNSLYDRDILGSTFRPVCRTPLVTLGQVFEQYDVKRCALLKLDCEGAEYEILHNAGPETLARIRMIAMEYHVGLNDQRPEELCTFLEAHGFHPALLPLIDEDSGYLYAARALGC